MIFSSANTDTFDLFKYEYKYFRSFQIRIQILSIFSNTNTNTFDLFKYEYKEFRSFQIRIQIISMFSNMNTKLILSIFLNYEHKSPEFQMCLNINILESISILFQMRFTNTFQIFVNGKYCT